MLEWFVGSSKASSSPKFAVLDSFKPLIPWSGMTVLASSIHGLGATLDGGMGFWESVGGRAETVRRHLADNSRRVLSKICSVMFQFRVDVTALSRVRWSTG